MKKNEAKKIALEMLGTGESKKSVFEKLTGEGMSGRFIANIIASYANPGLCEKYKGLIKAVIVIAYVQVLVGLVAGFVYGGQYGAIGGLVGAILGAAWTLLFAWGFTQNKAWAYNVTILLSVIQVPKQISNFEKAPIYIGTMISISCALIFFYFYVRTKIFPDYAGLFSIKKLNGAYEFKE
ncbi:hypothetical protein [Solimicrobium silvestre]|uniref:Uncharacterized protein n=1 Tax=Solimicrobium silvestre TaxID=2099400 RepID=A0A2S9GYY5_9BURK|nr:hypothetical protein [Solimicrobium silvestre]PRC92920.1 hypothetical protein S2091_2337 [Solimicrobium silvestre]